MRKLFIYYIVTIMLGCSTLLIAKTEHTGKVLEVLHSGPYSYLKVQEEHATNWVAVTRTPVPTGSVISYQEAMRVQDFESKTLHKTFKNLIFADAIRYQNKNTKAAPVPLSQKILHAKISPYKKPDTLSVEEIFLNAKKLNGKKVKVRGKVIKVARDIMKRDWVHIEDGTGDSEAGSDDLVFTATKSDVKKGDVVTAEGKVAIEKDFGYGYFYPVIIEESHFKKE